MGEVQLNRYKTLFRINNQFITSLMRARTRAFGPRHQDVPSIVTGLLTKSWHRLAGSHEEQQHKCINHRKSQIELNQIPKVGSAGMRLSSGYIIYIYHFILEYNNGYNNEI